MVIEQGDVFWLELGRPWGSEPGYRIVLQNDAYNRSKIGTAIVCMLTSNMSRARLPGNVVLREGEAGLPKRSVALATQLATVDKSQLVTRIGRASKQRVKEIIDGVALVLLPIS